MGPDGEESSGSTTSLLRHCCSRTPQLYINTRVFTYFPTSLAIIKWRPSGRLLSFCIRPLKPKCQDRVGRSNVRLVAWWEMDKCQMAIIKKKKNDNWKLVPRESRSGVKTPAPDLFQPIFTTALSVSPCLLGGGGGVYLGCEVIIWYVLCVYTKCHNAD